MPLVSFRCDVLKNKLKNKDNTAARELLMALKNVGLEQIVAVDSTKFAEATGERIEGSISMTSDDPGYEDIAEGADAGDSFS